MKYIIYNAKVITALRIIEGGAVVVENGVIGAVLENYDLSQFENRVDAGGLYLSAGFVDIHTHGAGGHDFMDGSEEAFITAAKTHAKYGTTTLLPTTTTSSDEDLKNTFDVFSRVKNAKHSGAKMPGLHLEGPYFSHGKKGAQDPRHIKPPAAKDYERILKWSGGNIIRWSAAPELEGSDKFAAFLLQNNIIPSIAHSEAVYEEVVRAYENGFKLITHFYNACSTITRVNGYRRLGVVESGYLIDGMSVELIADGHHLPSPLLRLVYKFKGAEKMILCTDSMRGAGEGEGESVIGSLTDGQKIIIEGGVAKLMDRSAFAGSVSTTDNLVRTMVKKVGVPLVEAVRMMTLNPAAAIRLDDKIGSVAINKAADLVLFDEDINVYKTIIDGRVVFEKAR